VKGEVFQAVETIFAEEVGPDAVSEWCTARGFSEAELHEIFVICEQVSAEQPRTAAIIAVAFQLGFEIAAARYAKARPE
jgi:hypothetical protein